MRPRRRDPILTACRVSSRSLEHGIHRRPARGLWRRRAGGAGRDVLVALTRAHVAARRSRSRRGVATVDGGYALLAGLGGTAVAAVLDPIARSLRWGAAAVLLVVAARFVLARFGRTLRAGAVGRLPHRRRARVRHIRRAHRDQPDDGCVLRSPDRRPADVRLAVDRGVSGLRARGSARLVQLAGPARRRRRGRGAPVDRPRRHDRDGRGVGCRQRLSRGQAAHCGLSRVPNRRVATCASSGRL